MFVFLEKPKKCQLSQKATDRPLPSHRFVDHGHGAKSLLLTLRRVLKAARDGEILQSPLQVHALQVALEFVSGLSDFVAHLHTNRNSQSRLQILFVGSL